ncbi:hypothetical protein ACPPVU_00390 [Mucilaginibacter sp. McL0603]|uniref:hypothetical protein n=1 Tax=Mucilaginibacter sp. McL0603 TaxID=3415670 RepID=UPI003CE7AB58
MKLIKFFSISCTIILSSNNFVQAQNEVESKQAIQIIKEFYIAYNTAWSANIAPKVLDQKLDSLKMKYCAITLMICLKGDLDHDVLINDQYTDVRHLKTLIVSKAPTKGNSYIVSYIAPTTNPSNKPIEEKVVIYLTVMKGARGIVIDSVGS